MYCSFIMLCLVYIGLDYVISEMCSKGEILQRNYRKMTISWSFSYNSFRKFHGKRIQSNNITVLYLNLSYSEACYKETVL